MRRCAQFHLSALAVAFATCSYGQGQQGSHSATTAATPNASTVSEPPARQVNFTAGDPVSGLKVSPVIILPTQCTNDGALFLEMLQPPSFMQQVLFAVTQKSSRDFEVSAMNDLQGTEVLSFFPDDKQVSVLVRATRETNPRQGEAKVRQSSYGFFLALFDRKGQYLRSVELAMHGVLPSHVAALPTGEYVVTGYDRANDMPRLYLVADDGQVIRSLVLPYNLGQYVPSSDPNIGEGMMNRSRVLGSILMTGHGDQVLVWRRGGKGPILSVGAHGSTREINLNVPKGMTLADILSSDTQWFAHFQKAQSQTDQAQDNHEMSYYQFDPSDGSLTSKLSIRGDTPEHTPALIACEEEGTFLSYETDDKGQTRILSAR